MASQPPAPKPPGSPAPATPTAQAPRRAPPSKGREQAPGEHPHAAHVREHIERLRQGFTGLADPGEVYLGHEAGEQFWELLGFRLHAHPTAVLGAVRFQRHDIPGASHARESVSAYVTSPPTPPVSDAHAPPPGHLSILLPRFHRTIPAFLKGLRNGEVPVPVHVSPEIVEVAFDFRTQNPSGLESVKRRAAPLRPHFFRTTAGHVIRGKSVGLGAGSARPFVAITEAEQLTGRGTHPLPTVIVNRRFIALAIAAEDEGTRLAAPNWLPFLPSGGTSKHLLLG